MLCTCVLQKGQIVDAYNAVFCIIICSVKFVLDAVGYIVEAYSCIGLDTAL